MSARNISLISPAICSNSALIGKSLAIFLQTLTTPIREFLPPPRTSNHQETSKRRNSSPLPTTRLRIRDRRYLNPNPSPLPGFDGLGNFLKIRFLGFRIQNRGNLGKRRGIERQRNQGGIAVAYLCFLKKFQFNQRFGWWSRLNLKTLIGISKRLMGRILRTLAIFHRRKYK